MRHQIWRRGSRRTAGARAVVTGAGSGIGRAFAVELGRRGGQVVCADVDLEGAEATLDLVVSAGGRASAVTCDVARVEDVQDLARAAEGWLEAPVELVVNNAGIGTGGRVVGDISLDDWRRTLAVNLSGVIHGCHVFAPKLRALGRGGIINVASAAGFAAAPMMAPYNVSKAGVLALSETLAAELSGTSIAVTVLCPTFVKTRIVESASLPEDVTRWATRAMEWTGVSPERIATTTLDAHDRGDLYVVPQMDARALWRLKRFFPVGYTRAIGGLARRALRGVT